jgi:hypothetical protein
MKSYDPEKKRITLSFIDKDIEPFTYNYLHNKYSAQHVNPFNQIDFWVKFNPNKSKIYLDKGEQINTTIYNLMDQNVELVITIFNYNFKDKSSGKKIQGFSLNLVKMQPI